MHSPDTNSAAAPRIAADILDRLRAERPRVHCITNTVAQNFTANMLLAAGASPSTTISPGEVEAFVAGAKAVLINLGTLDAQRHQATESAITAAKQNRLPWVLDPVLIDRSPHRAAFARELMGRAPQIVRLNTAEFATLAGEQASPEAAARYAAARGVVVALSGATDIVADGKRVARIANGDPLMDKVTAMGCAGSALVAACLAVEADAPQAAIAGLLILNIAGELAAKQAKGPGTFAVAILDTLHALDRAAILERAKVS
jgi:hydroxyethylthiazole kinase